MIRATVFAVLLVSASAAWANQETSRVALAEGDFAAQRDGFGGAASGGDKTYGDNLSSYFIGNADRLGVLYVIWYRQIWLPSSGWMSYSGAYGDPSSDHTNHVHLSVY